MENSIQLELNAPGEPRESCERRFQVGWLGDR